MLPRWTEGDGFFGRSVKPLPSILSFLSVFVVEVSIVDRQGSGLDKKTTNAQKVMYCGYSV